MHRAEGAYTTVHVISFNCLHYFSSSPVLYPEDPGLSHGGMHTLDVADEAIIHHLSTKDGRDLGTSSMCL